MGDVHAPEVAAMTDRASHEPERDRTRGPTAALARRWPLLLALVVSAPGFLDTPTPGSVRALAEAMLLLPLWYMVIAAVGRRC